MATIYVVTTKHSTRVLYYAILLSPQISMSYDVLVGHHRSPVIYPRIAMTINEECRREPSLFTVVVELPLRIPHQDLSTL